MERHQPFLLRCTHGRLALELRLLPAGQDWQLLLTGGDAHIGAVILAEPGDGPPPDAPTAEMCIRDSLCADGTNTPHIIVSLLPGQLICVFNLPRTAGLSLRGARYLYLDAVHRQCFVDGKPILVERIAVDQAQGNG